MSSRLTKDALKEALEVKLAEVWQSGGAGRKALREELAPTKIIVDYGYGYRALPNVGPNGETVFVISSSVFPVPEGKLPMCKVFRLDGFAHPVDLGDLYSLDPKATDAFMPLVTLDGSILVPVVNSPDRTQMAIWRYDGEEWSKVYEDTGTNLTQPMLAQDIPVSDRPIYAGYRNNVRSRVLKSVDDGETWSLVYDVAEASPSDAYFYGCGAWNARVVLTKREKRTFIRSTDAGSTWTESPVLPSKPRTVHFYPQLDLGYITSEGFIYYSRDYFATYRRIRVPAKVSRYLIMAKGIMLFSDMWTYTTIYASKDLCHTIVPIHFIPDNSPRIAAYGDYLFIGYELRGRLVRVRLPETLDGGLSCPIMLWEDESVPDTGETTDYLETQYNDKKTFYIISDQSGTLYVQAYDEIAGDFKDIDSMSVSADTLTPYMTYYDARLMRLRFVPSAAATVSAWAMLE